MKRFLSFLTVILACQMMAFAYDPNERAKVVGANVLSKNSLPSVEIVVQDLSTVSNDNILITNILNVSSYNLTYTGNDNEVAAVVAQELGAIVNASASKKQLVSSLANAFVENITDTKTKERAALVNELSLSNMSKKDLMEADITGVDLMINAGYNPLAMIVTLGKMPGSLTEAIFNKPNNIKRTMNIYDYLSYNYPDKVKAGYNCQEYKAFLAYIEPTITKRQKSASALKKFQTTQAKAKQKRAQQVAKYKMKNGVSGWDVTSELLQNFAGQITAE